MYLGLDLGTSGLKVMIVDSAGQAIATANANYPVTQPHPSWSEQNPADWCNALQNAIAELKQNHAQAVEGIKALGISGQMHGATLLDADGDVLRPCILWNDTRSHVEALELDQQEDFRQIAGNIIFPGFTAPKLIWVARHEPEIFAKVKTVLLPKDYLVYWLSGKRVSEMSDSSGTGWLDISKREWSDKLIQKTGMQPSQLGKLYEGSEVIGTLDPVRAKQLGLPQTCKVVAGGGDNAVAACGVGALKEGVGFVSLGTSGVILVARDGYYPAPESGIHTFCHAVPERWYQMSVMLAATDNLNWLARIVDNKPDVIANKMGETIGQPSHVQYLPYLSGERTPHNDSRIRGAFLNLDIATQQTDLTQAVLEGVAFAYRDCLHALEMTGCQVSSLLGIGGGAKSHYWIELIATILNLPIDLPEKGESAAAMGAARLAMIGDTGRPPEDIISAPKIYKTVTPRKELTAAYATAYAAWRNLYPNVKNGTKAIEN